MAITRQPKYQRILVEYRRRLHYLLNFELKHTDGSFYIRFVRSGVRQEYRKMKVDVKNSDFTYEDTKDSSSHNGGLRGFSISYHATGRVNYNNTGNAPVFFEPLMGISKPTHICTYSIPSIEKLDLYTEPVSDKDFIAPVAEDHEGRMDLFCSLAPWNTLPITRTLSIQYRNFFSFNLTAADNSLVPPDELRNHFILVTPPAGYFEQQMLSQDMALIRFHQSLQGTQELIIYPPNGEGVYKIICSVPMRIPPTLSVSFADPTLECIVESVTRSVVTFSVRDQHGQKIRHAVAITGVELSAEL